MFSQKNYAFSQNSYYHLKIAQMYADGNFDLTGIGTMQRTQFQGQFVDQHFGYHLLLTPFAFFGLEFLSMKILNIICLFFVIYFASLRFRKRHRIYVVAGLMGLLFLPQTGIYRLFWDRPQV
ncbi:MAG: hypothetical protein ACK5P5_06225, partial [Pseudobdellovibrionaceae bacterium]